MTKYYVSCISGGSYLKHARIDAQTLRAAKYAATEIFTCAPGSKIKIAVEELPSLEKRVVAIKYASDLRWTDVKIS